MPRMRHPPHSPTPTSARSASAWTTVRRKTKDEGRRTKDDKRFGSDSSLLPARYSTKKHAPPPTMTLMGTNRLITTDSFETSHNEGSPTSQGLAAKNMPATQV